jgi:hypothetical protein
MHAKTNAILVGVLFITATVAASIGYEVILRPILEAPDPLVSIAENETQVLIGLLLAVINSAAIVGIAVAVYPVLRTHNEALAIGYLAARIVECGTFIVGLITLLALLTASQVFVQAEALDSPAVQVASTILLAAYDGSFWLAVTLILGTTALILNDVLYRSRLVPRFISIWGLIAGALVFTQGVLDLFGPDPAIMSLPIAVQEMVLAVWLIVKGFRTSALPPQTTA